MDGRPFGHDAGGHHRHFDRQRARVKPGEAFFAIKGETLDGHDFANQAMKAGAAVLVVAEAQAAGASARLRVPMIVVPDVLAALEKLGVAARAPGRGRRSSR